AFLAEPFDERGGIGDLAFRLRERLALLGGHQCCEVVLVREHQLAPATQDARAVLRRARGPGRKCPRGGLDGAARLGTAGGGDRAEPLARGGILHFECAPRIRVAPLAVYVALLAQQGWVSEFHGFSTLQPTCSAKNASVRSSASLALGASY